MTFLVGKSPTIRIYCLHICMYVYNYVYEAEGCHCHYIDFRESKNIYSIFRETSDPGELIKLLQFQLRKTIDAAHGLIIFDEIQDDVLC